jgi:hypothetical protein
MCILCEIKKLTQETGPQDALHVGVVSEPLRLDLMAFRKAQATAGLDVDQMVMDASRAFINGEITEAEAELRQEAVHTKQAADEEKYGAESEALWNRVYEELAITDHERSYTIDGKTGEITTRRRRGETGAFPNGR